MTDGTNPVIDGLLAEWKRLEDAFHDALPNQGETGDPTAGKAMCQFLYDNAPALRAALNTRAAPPANVERVDRLIDAARMYEASCRLSDDDYAFAAQKLERAKSAALEAMPDVVGLREALEPFAACVEQIAPDEDDEEWAKFRLLIKDYRRAAAALAKVSGVSKPLPDSPSRS